MKRHIKDKILALRNDGTTVDLDFDEYRLLSVTTTKSEAFTYDPAGNRLTGSGATDTTYQSNAANQMTQGRKLSYGYDNRGNQTTKTVPGVSDKTWTRTWDYNNRLTQEQKVKGTEVKTVTYKYDPFGRRIEKKFVQTKNGVTETETSNYLYDNEDIAVEYFTTAGGTEKTFVTHGHGIDEPLALERGGSYFYFHQDGLGSITHITNAAKTVVQGYAYDAYGMVTATTSFRNSYQYAGYAWDWETGTYHVRNRGYDPMAGIFIQKDPIGFAGGDVNLYGYVQNNPINLTDPSGLDPWGRNGSAEPTTRCHVNPHNDRNENLVGATIVVGGFTAYAAPAIASLAQQAAALANGARMATMAFAGTTFGQRVLNSLPEFIEGYIPGAPPNTRAGVLGNIASYQNWDPRKW